jgi:hypothetical protein
MVNAICVAKEEYFRTEGLMRIILKSGTLELLAVTGFPA